MPFNYQIVQLGNCETENTRCFTIRRPSFFGGWKYITRKYYGNIYFYDFTRKFDRAFLTSKEKAEKLFEHFTSSKEAGIKVVKEFKSENGNCFNQNIL